MALGLARRPKLQLLDALGGPHGIDGYLEQIDPLLVRGECRAEVLATDRLTSESVTLTLGPNRAWRGFHAGQFIRIAVEIDGVRHERCYSPASVEGRREVEITVKRHPEGAVSSFLVDRARPGMVLGLSEAEGDFRLPRRRPASVLLIGGGSGLTPLTAMLRTLLAEGYGRPITLLHYAPDPERAIYREELARLAAEHSNFKLLRSYTRAPALGEIEGHFNPLHLSQVDPCFTQAETFACGPPSLLDAVRATWSGGLEQRLHLESFLPPAFARACEAGEGTIRFTDSSVEVQNSGASLLQQAEAAGLRPAYGCRMGICHSCSCRKVAGTHRNLITGEVSPAAEEEIQLCVSAPLGDIAVAL